MRVLFIGSGAVACPALRRLASGACGELVGVVTQPERPRGRGRRPELCPAGQIARAAGIPPRTPERIRDAAVVADLAALRPEIIVVAAYGQFLPRALLEIPRWGAINIHPSLLPRYRGAAPIQWAVANGETETGVSIAYMTERMDAGDIIFAEREPIRAEDTALTLTPRLAEMGARLLERALAAIAEGRAPRTPQDESRATFAPKLSKADGRIQWNTPARVILNRLRGFQPWPGAFFYWPRRDLTIAALQAAVEDARGAPGEILEIGAAGPLVATGEGALRLKEVRPAGGRAMSGAAFCAGYRPAAGERFGRPLEGQP